jgi:hypothetical protein
MSEPTLESLQAELDALRAERDTLAGELRIAHGEAVERTQKYFLLQKTAPRAALELVRVTDELQLVRRNMNTLHTTLKQVREKGLHVLASASADPRSRSLAESIGAYVDAVLDASMLPEPVEPHGQT